MTGTLAALAGRAYGGVWEARRRAYAAGLLRPHRVPARVVSVGNLAVGGTGKTTLVLSLARRAREAGIDVAVICRRYRPGVRPGTAGAPRGDEELLYADALGEGHVRAGTSKWRDAHCAATEGRRLLIVDDGFSHWALARDLDIVLLDAHDPWAGGALLPAGRLREPRRALQRADWIVVSHAADVAAAGAAIAAVRPWAPAARFAAGRHRLARVRCLGGQDWVERGAAHVVTATGNPAAVGRSALEAGFAPVRVSSYRDHHWFRPGEIRREQEAAAADGATLVLTAKDAVRWPQADPSAAVLEVEWEWLIGGDELERQVGGA